jgi:hypothetical protein
MYYIYSLYIIFGLLETCISQEVPIPGSKGQLAIVKVRRIHGWSLHRLQFLRKSCIHCELIYNEL